MDTASELSKHFEELTALFNTRMDNFEKGLQQQATSSNAPSQPTMRSLSADYLQFKTFIWKAISMMKAQMELIIASLDRQECHARRKILLFHGIPEEKDEVLPEKLRKVLCDRMKLTFADTLRSPIEACYRLGSREETPRPVLVKFTDMDHRSVVWNAKKLLKGTKVSVSEFLTKLRQEVFVTARKHFGMKSCWSSDGNIIILLPDSTRRKITSLTELRQLKSEHPGCAPQQADKPRRGAARREQ